MLPLYILAGSASVFSPSLLVKSIGLFVQGVLHLKIPLAYTYAFEVFEDDWKAFAATVINAVEMFGLGLIGVALQFVTRDLTFIVETMFLMQLSLVLIFLLLAPESPHWLLMNGHHLDTIKVLNYIAWMNGYEPIEQNAKFDYIGQAIKQSET